MILFDIRDMRDEDMTSKLDFCQECNGENIDGFACLPDPENPYTFGCFCRSPLEKNSTGSCVCPEGYESNILFEETDVERLMCYSKCDFPETDPCVGTGLSCVQEAEGPVCVDPDKKPDTTTTTTTTKSTTKTSTTTTTTTQNDTDLGGSASLTTISSLLVGALLMKTFL